MTFTARDLFEAERQGRGPSAEARARVRAKLVKRLGSSVAVAAAAASAATPAAGAAGGATLAVTFGKAIALCVLGGTVLGAGYVATHRRSSEERRVAAVAAERSAPAAAPIAAPARAAFAPDPPPALALAPPVAPEPSEPTAAAPPSAARRAAVVAAPVRGSAPVSAREESVAAEPVVAPAVPRVPENTAPAASPAAADGLQAELALVRAAHDALRAGRPDVALDRMEQHRRDFPGGALAEERDALRVSAICALGRADAASEAQAFLASHPESPFVGRIRDACPH
jgi:hypothetical protein